MTTHLLSHVRRIDALHSHKSTHDVLHLQTIWQRPGLWVVDGRGRGISQRLPREVIASGDADVVQDIACHDPVHREIKVGIACQADPQLLETSPSPLQTADGVLRLYPQPCQLVVLVFVFSRLTLRTLEWANHMPRVEHTLVTEQVLASREEDI